MSEKVRNSVDNKQSLHNTTTNSKYRSLFNRSIVLKFLVGKNAPTGYNKIIIQKIFALIIIPIFSTRSPKMLGVIHQWKIRAQRNHGAVLCFIIDHYCNQSIKTRLVLSEDSHGPFCHPFSNIDYFFQHILLGCLCS
jgi:hypothetical protein